MPSPKNRKHALRVCQGYLSRPSLRVCRPWDCHFCLLSWAFLWRAVSLSSSSAFIDFNLENIKMRIGKVKGKSIDICCYKLTKKIKPFPKTSFHISLKYKNTALTGYNASDNPYLKISFALVLSIFPWAFNFSCKKKFFLVQSAGKVIIPSSMLFIL